MNFHLPSLCLILALVGGVRAEVPRKPVLSKYQSLWKDSPFTTKPEGPTVSTYNPMQDYVLLGVSPIEQGYRVTMLNRKRPNDRRLIVESHRPAAGFEIKEVMRKEGDPLATTVRLQRGTTTGVIAFEEKFLTLKPPPAAAAPNREQRGNSGGATKPAGEAKTPPRPPRRRIVQPGTTVQRPGQQQRGNNQEIQRILNLPNASGGNAKAPAGRSSGR